MTERIGESSLPVNAPWRLMVADLIERAVRTCRHGPGYEGVRVVAEHLYPHRRRVERSRAIEPCSHRLMQEERRSLDLQAHDAAEVPQLGGTKRTLVPFGRGSR